jgi:hypothetical protein
MQLVGFFSRDSVARFSVSGFYRESSSLKPLKITLGSFRIFSKILGDIHKSRCTIDINDTGGKFATGINDTGGKFTTGTVVVIDTGGKWTPVSTKRGK